MKKNTLALIISLILIGCNNQIKKNDWIKDNLKGRIESYSEFSYEAIERFGKIEKIKNNWKNNIQKKYNEKGNVIELNNYKSEGSLSSMYSYKYNDKENIIELNIYNSDGSLDIKHSYKYDNKGNNTEEQHTKNGRSWLDTYKYDSKGNIIENKSYNVDGGLIMTRICKYDENGNKIKDSELCIFDKKLSNNYTYKYDKYGNEIEKITYDSDSTLISRWTYKYDNNRNIIEESGFLIDEYEPSGSLSRTLIYKYEFDQQGNWIKKIEFENNIPTCIFERKYEYYD